MAKSKNLLELPEDPELAFVEFEKQLREEMNESIRSEYSWEDTQNAKLYYIYKLMAFHDAQNFSLLQPPQLSRGTNSIEFRNTFDNFLDEVTYWTTQIEIRHAQRLRPISTIVSLTPEMKKQIHHFINRIRAIVEPINIPIAKKEAIWSKLNALADEVDRDRTKAEAAMALALEIASATGEAARSLSPVKEIIDAITNLLAKAKEMTEFRPLPPPSARKRLEGPRKQLPKPQSGAGSANSDDLDDETPF